MVQHRPFDSECVINGVCETLHCDYAYDSVDRIAKCEFGKTLYAEIYGKIRGFRIKQVEIYPMSYGIRIPHTQYNYSQVLVCDVAGIGEMRIGKCFDKRFTIYDSVEDFKQGNGRELKYVFLGRDDVKNIVEEMFGVTIIDEGNHIFPHNKTMRYVWDGVKAVTFHYDIPIYFTYDNKNGYQLPTWYKYDDECGFPTKEGCEFANNVDVVDFEDEPKEEEKPIKVKVTIAEVEVEIPKEKLAELEDFAKKLAKK